MRLICPECNVLYDVADNVIPSAGCDVECSACGQVWFQSPKAGEDSPTYTMPDLIFASDEAYVTGKKNLSEDPSDVTANVSQELVDIGPLPILQRELPEDVLSILREETAHELNARKAAKKNQTLKNAAPTISPSDQTAESGSVAGGNKTTFEPLPRRRIPRTLPDVEQLAATIQTEYVPLSVETSVAEAAADKSVDDVRQTIPENIPKQNSRYITGFIRGLAVAVAFLIAYIAGSGWVETGQAPQTVMSLVSGIDTARTGLRDAVLTLVGNNK